MTAIKKRQSTKKSADRPHRERPSRFVAKLTDFSSQLNPYQAEFLEQLIRVLNLYARADSPIYSTDPQGDQLDNKIKAHQELFLKQFIESIVKPVDDDGFIGEVHLAASAMLIGCLKLRQHSFIASDNAAELLIDQREKSS